MLSILLSRAASRTCGTFGAGPEPKWQRARVMDESDGAIESAGKRNGTNKKN